MNELKIAFLFPGQGSQSLGMLNGWLESSKYAEIAQNCIAQADQALPTSISEIIQNGPQEALNLTINTQPAMLLADVLAFKAWQQTTRILPHVLAGHSLGEYAALTASGVFSLSQAIAAVRVRAQAMQEAVPAGQGGMAAILGLTDEQVQTVCNQATQGEDLVQAVNYNAPAQVVIAGTASAVLRACEIAKSLGAKRALPLPVSAPFHSGLMKPAANILEQHLNTLELQSPSIRCVHNVDVAVHQERKGMIDALVKQAYHPVRWVETIRAMDAMGTTHYVECGPGKVLMGLVKRITDKPVFNIQDPQSLEFTLNALEQG